MGGGELDGSVVVLAAQGVIVVPVVHGGVLSRWSGMKGKCAPCPGLKEMIAQVGVEGLAGEALHRRAWTSTAKL
jgi:hypothetical protein